MMMMYTNSDPQSVTSILRQQSDGSKEEVECPLALKSYKYMGGVDRGDQQRGYYRCKVKSRKFYKYIFYFLIDVAITNAFILHQGWSGSSNKIPIKKFRIELAKEIIGGYCSRRRGGCNGALIKPLPVSHFPVKKLSTSHKLQRGRCTKCSQYQKRSDTHWYCQECGVWLCHTGTESTYCFLSWHKNII